MDNYYYGILLYLAFTTVDLKKKRFILYKVGLQIFEKAKTKLFVLLMFSI